ncbi:Hsp70 family protein [Lederbergia galactosidilytica]|uniref:Chaperone protein DnaK n=1 Tax=Lederbergia galactosidilytica TaxID=217031 RepID=A0A177ZTV7_9BACI|nr:Hsp70 family protein [Lederbergia galactosidilytica]OAK70770.1 hypothetical protein ABB05_11710 [Lederbergia galactosidilytica]
MKVGIDLGTTNSAVAYMNANGTPEIITNSDGERTTPSVILVEGGKAIVGEVAKEASVSQVEDTIQFIKRQMGNKSFKFPLPGTDRMVDAVEASAIILKKIVQDAEAELNEKVTDAVITVPAYFDDSKRNATKDAAEMIGLNVLKIINEPTAAALAYYHLEKEKKDQMVAIYDLGGGTFDVSIVSIKDNEIQVLATDGDSNLGGFDFDNAIFNYILEKFEDETGIDLYDDDEAMQELRENAEKCKKSLTKRNKYVVPVSSSGHSLRVEITKELFQGLIESLLNRTQLVMEETVAEAGLTWQDINKVLLVGGSTRTPFISEMIEGFTGLTPSKELNPDEVVALGAAVQASLVEADETTNSKVDIIVRDVNSHSLGVLSTDDHNNYVNSIILPRNSEIPCQESRTFYSVNENQQEIKLDVTEGEDEDPEYIKIIGTSTIQLPSGLPMSSPIEITISYDKNGIVHTRAKDLFNDIDLGEMVIERQSNLTQQEFEVKKETLLSIEVE